MERRSTLPDNRQRSLPASALPLSVALGDVASPGEFVRSIATLGERCLGRTPVLKLGSLVSAIARVGSGLCSRSPAAATGDWVSCPSGGRGGLRGQSECGLRRSGSGLGCRRLGGRCAGLLLDTWTKDGRHLFDWIRVRRVRTWSPGPTRRSAHRGGRRLRSGAVIAGGLPGADPISWGCAALSAREDGRARSAEPVSGPAEDAGGRLPVPCPAKLTRRPRGRWRNARSPCESLPGKWS